MNGKKFRMGIIQSIIIKLKREKFKRSFLSIGASGFGSYGYGDYCTISGAEKIRIGNHSWCGKETDIFVGEKGKLTIGNNFQSTSRLCIECNTCIQIGDDVLIAPNVYIGKAEEETDNIVIEDGVWIGQNTSILTGAYIGEHSIIGAGSVVKNKIPKYSIAAGNPAKVIKIWDFNKNTWVKVNA